MNPNLQVKNQFNTVTKDHAAFTKFAQTNNVPQQQAHAVLAAFAAVFPNGPPQMPKEPEMPKAAPAPEAAPKAASPKAASPKAASPKAASPKQAPSEQVVAAGETAH